MGVDAADPADAVPEALVLDDLGDPVLDEPGFVAVAQVVEMQPSDDRGDAVVGVALDGGMPVAAVGAGAAVQAAGAAGEHMVVMVAVEVRAEQVDQERGRRMSVP